MTSFPFRVAIGGDHAGFPLKRSIIEMLGDQTLAVIDCGTRDETSCDYPDFAVAVAKRMASGEAQRGILVCGSGVGISVAMNKIRGMRAAICHDTYSAHQGVEHDDMNVLCLGSRVVGSELAFDIVRSFMGANYTAVDRHARRLEKVLRLEKSGTADLG